MTQIQASSSHLCSIMSPWQDLEANNRQLVSRSEQMRQELERVVQVRGFKTAKSDTLVQECGMLRHQLEEYSRLHSQCNLARRLSPGPHFQGIP